MVRVSGPHVSTWHIAACFPTYPRMMVFVLFVLNLFLFFFILIFIDYCTFLFISVTKVFLSFTEDNPVYSFRSSDGGLSIHIISTEIIFSPLS